MHVPVGPSAPELEFDEGGLFPYLCDYVTRLSLKLFPSAKRLRRKVGCNSTGSGEYYDPDSVYLSLSRLSERGSLTQLFESLTKPVPEYRLLTTRLTELGNRFLLYLITPYPYRV
jgi:hypothetical protein